MSGWSAVRVYSAPAVYKSCQKAKPLPAYALLPFRFCHRALVRLERRAAEGANKQRKLHTKNTGEANRAEIKFQVMVIGASTKKKKQKTQIFSCGLRHFGPPKWRTPRDTMQ